MNTVSKKFLFFGMPVFLLGLWGGVDAQPLTSEPFGHDTPAVAAPAKPAAPVLNQGGIQEEDLGGQSRGLTPLQLPAAGEAPDSTVAIPEVNLPGGLSGEEGGTGQLPPGEVTIPPQAEIPGTSDAAVVARPPDLAVPAVDPGSIIAKITPETTPRRAASLRLTEEGRQLLEAGEYQKALQRFEKTIAIDSTNPYSYYYLALVHHQMANHQAAANFLDVAESLLSEEPFWLARVYSLKGENFKVQGALEQADLSYGRALKLDPNNRTAFEALTQIQGGTEP